MDHADPSSQMPCSRSIRVVIAPICPAAQRKPIRDCGEGDGQNQRVQEGVMQLCKDLPLTIVASRTMSVFVYQAQNLGDFVPVCGYSDHEIKAGA
jgi:hypothetical protein